MIVKKRQTNLGNGEITLTHKEYYERLAQQPQNMGSQKISPIVWLGIAGFAYMLFTSKK